MPSVKSRSSKSSQGTDKPKSDSIVDLVQQTMKDDSARFKSALLESRWDTVTASENGPAAAPKWRSRYLADITNNSASETTGEPAPHHTVENVTSVISTLQSLEETLPGIVHAANALGGCGFNATPYTTTADIGVAVHMLREYRRRIDAEIRLRDDEQAKQAARVAHEVGVQAGIDQEKARVKEAKRGRRR